jgi:hypothetical protein
MFTHCPHHVYFFWVCLFAGTACQSPKLLLGRKFSKTTAAHSSKQHYTAPSFCHAHPNQLRNWVLAKRQVLSKNKEVFLELKNNVHNKVRVGNNSIGILLTDREHNRLTADRIYIRAPYFVEHRTSSPIVPHITQNNEGVYVVDNIYVFKAGIWRFDVKARLPTGPTHFVFDLCVED